MKTPCRFTLLSCALAVSVFAQAPDATKKKQKAPPAPPIPEVVAKEIPGVIRGGTKVVLMRAGFNATEGVCALNDGSGSVLFTEDPYDLDRAQARAMEKRAPS